MSLITEYISNVLHRQVEIIARNKFIIKCVYKYNWHSKSKVVDLWLQKSDSIILFLRNKRIDLVYKKRYNTLPKSKKMQESGKTNDCFFQLGGILYSFVIKR